MEPKKISFGFSKINKKLNLLTNKEALKNESKVELIKCLEGQEIKLYEEKAEEKPLIIPLKETQKTSAALASLIKRRAVLLGEDEQEKTIFEDKNKTAEEISAKSNNGPEDIEKQAARELLAELQADGSSDPSSKLVLPVVKPDDLPLEGAKESSLDDYESIPIQDFGKAMLRGMGWAEPPKVSVKGPSLNEAPMVRPKGMGLGADKALKRQALLVAPDSNEVLEVKRNAYVRILGGKHKDLYGQIEGFDDHAGRVIVKMAIGSFKEAFNEFLCQPVSRKEYAQYGKCINSTKYEEYKKKENEFGQIILTKDELDEYGENSNDKRKNKKERYDSSDEPVNDSKYYNNRDEKVRKKKIYKDNVREKNREDEKYHNKERERGKEYNKEKNEDDSKDRKRDVEIEKPLEDKKGHNRDRDEEREYKKEKNEDVDRNVKRENFKDYGKDGRRENDRLAEKKRRKDLDRDNEDRRNKERYGESDRNRERKRYESKYDDRNQRTQSYNNYKVTQVDSHRDRERGLQRDNGDRDYHKDNKDEQKHRDNKDEQKHRDRDYYVDRNIKRNDKAIQLDESTDSNSHTSKHKNSSRKDTKSTKDSKKSMKRKSKYKNYTFDSETSSSPSSSDSSSDSEEEKRKKYKKKSKNKIIKKQRERSRSRGRR